MSDTNYIADYQRVLDRRRADRKYLAERAKAKRLHVETVEVRARIYAEILAEDRRWREARILSREEFLSPSDYLS